MSESIIKTQVLDDVSPEVRKLMDSLSPEGRRKLLRRLAHLFVEDAKRNFDDPANRPEPWADKKVYKRGRGLFRKPRLHRFKGRKTRGLRCVPPRGHKQNAAPSVFFAAKGRQQAHRPYARRIRSANLRVSGNKKIAASIYNIH